MWHTQLKKKKGKTQATEKIVQLQNYAFENYALLGPHPSFSCTQYMFLEDQWLNTGQ